MWAKYTTGLEWKRRNISQLLLQDKITAQITSFAENEVFTKWFQRYVPWPWAKHLTSATQQVFHLQHRNSSTYLQQIQSQVWGAGTTLLLCPCTVDDTKVMDILETPPATARRQWKHLSGHHGWLFRSQRGTRDTWAWWPAGVLRSPARGGYSQSREPWAQRKSQRWDKTSWSGWNSSNHIRSHQSKLYLCC